MVVMSKPVAGRCYLALLTPSAAHVSECLRQMIGDVHHYGMGLTLSADPVLLLDRSIIVCLPQLLQGQRPVRSRTRPLGVTGPPCMLPIASRQNIRTRGSADQVLHTCDHTCRCFVHVCMQHWRIHPGLMHDIQGRGVVYRGRPSPNPSPCHAYLSPDGCDVM